MAKEYPLYDLLLNKVNERGEEKELSIDVNKICSTISGMSQYMRPEEVKSHYDEIALLIFHHSLINNTSYGSAIPFDGKLMSGGKGLLYHGKNLPPELLAILAQYIEDYSTTECIQSK